MRILLTGGSGLLGSAIRQIADMRRYECICLNRAELSWHNQLKNLERVKGFDVVIHAAANTNVEWCELNPASCYRDNTLLTEIIAKAVLDVQGYMVFISSTGVYGDKKDFAPFCEFDEVNPLTHHHRSKFIAENITQKLLPQSLIIRTGWLFGGCKENVKNFVAKRIEEAKLSTSGQIFSNLDQQGNPCYNLDIAERILDLIELKHCGVFNCVNSGIATRYDYVKEIIRQAHMPVEVIPVRGKQFGRVANVSNNESAINWKAENYGFRNMPDWRESLATYVQKIF